MQAQGILSGILASGIVPRLHGDLVGVTADQHHIQFTSGLHSFAHPSALIANQAIVSAKVGAGVLATPHLANQGILSASIGSGQVGQPHLAAGPKALIFAGL